MREHYGLGAETFWLAVGFLGQGAFTARFLVQWLASEKKRDSVMPVAFWWLSLSGGLVLLTYAVHRRDPVIVLGQVTGLLVYSRNLMLLARTKRNTVVPPGTEPHLAARSAFGARRSADRVPSA